MYSTCLFCNRDLGSNELVEHFPVGRRLAFDETKGRLWVVCTSCERWNLSPLEERWEAIEECERLFSATRMRVSTENVGLARLSEGLTLIRIGAPQRPEMAAWRYGDQFGRRRRTAMMTAGAGLTVIGAVVIGGVTAGVGIASFGGLLVNMANRVVKGNPDKVVARLPSGDTLHAVKRKHLEKIRLTPVGSDSLRITIEADRKRIVEYNDREALRAAGVLLPALNRYGGTRKQVASAVRLLEEAGDPFRLFRESQSRGGHGQSPLHKFDYPIRLALEMAAHEESERRALEGELALLEEAWKQAEEIAAISDSLLVPSSVEEWLAKLRGKRAES